MFLFLLFDIFFKRLIISPTQGPKHIRHKQPQTKFTGDQRAPSLKLLTNFLAHKCIQNIAIILLLNKRRFLPLYYTLYATHHSVRIEESSIYRWWSRVLVFCPLLVSRGNSRLNKEQVWRSKILNAPILFKKRGKITFKYCCSLFLKICRHIFIRVLYFSLPPDDLLARHPIWIVPRGFDQEWRTNYLFLGK